MAVGGRWGRTYSMYTHCLLTQQPASPRGVVVACVRTGGVLRVGRTVRVVRHSAGAPCKQHDTFSHDLRLREHIMWSSIRSGN